MGGLYGRIGRPHFGCAWLFGIARSLSACALVVGCASNDPKETLPPEPPIEVPDHPAPIPAPDLRINEVVSNNEGVWVDEVGEADDYIELYNPATYQIDISKYLIFDSKGGHSLPKLTIPSLERVLLWADSTPDQGELHLPFKISSSGEHLRLVKVEGTTVDDLVVPALAEHHAYMRVPDGTGAFVDCGWATPARTNGTACGPQQKPRVVNKNPFAPFTWPSQFPPEATPLVISEARLKPADFVEVRNSSHAALNLSGYSLRLGAKDASMPWPGANDGVLVPWPQASLGAGERISIPISAAMLTDIAESPNFEGVLSAFDVHGNAVDRMEFTDWPSGASLARDEQGNGQFRFCAKATPGAENSECSPLAEREIGGYLHDLQTPGDFRAMATHSALGEESVEVLVNIEQGNTVTFLNSNVYEFHYDFVRRVLQGLPAIDRCAPQTQRAWERGWAQFVLTEFEDAENRHLIPLSLVRHGEVSTMEFAGATAITPEQLTLAFFSVMTHVDNPQEWSIRPQTPEQVELFRPSEGKVPLVDTDAPYEGVSFQPLVLGTTYGTLRVATVDELDSLNLGPRDVVLTDGIPNDIPLIAGLVTETFQTPLAHVNVLSRGRGTPNMALREARKDPRIAPYIGQLVRFDVFGSGFALSAADPGEALAFWDSKKPAAGTLVPRVDLSRRGVVPLDTCWFKDVPLIGGKAAQFAELDRVALCDSEGDVSIPDHSFAIPVVHSLEHFAASGATALLAELRQDPAFLVDPKLRAEGLTQVRGLITSYPLDSALHDEVAAALAARWPGQRVRFRSSSNVEDLAGFNGAGLYESEGIEADNAQADMDDAIRTVWASMWNDRAFAEREYYNVDQSQVAMGVLVHPGFPSERANGVAISRNVIDPTIGGQIYINAQVGEALVTNPAPGIISDVFAYSTLDGTRTFYERSDFSPLDYVMTEKETDFLACNLMAIHEHFRPLLDPDESNPWFAMDIEFKLMGPKRSLVIKQARSYSFGRSAPDGWCEF